MLYGLDYLAGARYRDVILREHPEGWAAGFFSNVDGFGPSWGVIRDLLSTGRCPLLRIQALWDDAHQWRPGHEQVILRQIPLANKLKADFPNVEVQFSPFCEHNLKGAALRDLFAKVRQRAEGLQLVNSPYLGDFLFDANVINECHGTKKSPNRGKVQYSFDGTSAVDANTQKMKDDWNMAHVFFFWVPQFNLRKNTDDKTPRAQRKAVPTGQLIDSVIYLHQPKGKTSLGNQHIWKTHADQHNAPVPEPRALKPVLITPVRANRAELVAQNGQVIEISSKAFPFADGRFRYYFPTFGYQLAEKARRIQNGSPVVSVVVGGKAIGTVNPAFRDGSFRS
jgi:hypothetical protein